MEKTTFPPPPPTADANAAGHLERLQRKFQVKPYLERFRAAALTVSSLTWLLNAFSIATAFLCVFSFLQIVLPADWLAVAFSLLFLTGLEVLKRLFIPGLFQDWFQFRRLAAGGLIFAAGLTAVSVTLSYSGAAEAVRLLSEPVQLTDIDQVRAPYLSQLTDIDQDKQTAQKQTWKGRLTSEASRQMTVLQRQEAAVREAMLAAVRDAENANKSRAFAHEAKTMLKAGHFAAAALLLDLLLVLALGWLEFYDWRSLAELGHVDGQMTRKPKTVKSLSNDQEADRKPAASFPLTDARLTVRGFNALDNAMHHCGQCGQAFQPKTTWQKFCSDVCRTSHHAAKHGKPFIPGKIYQQIVDK
jgi:hypothetical protein